MRDIVDRVMSEVDRRDFLPDQVQEMADFDAALPIAGEQTNSQPRTVAAMLRLLDVQPGDRVLDVGSGSGWTTAILARLVGPRGRVLGVERVGQLVEPSRRAVNPYAEGRAEIRRARSGVLGLPEEGPFDRILVSAQPSELPRQLVDQLSDGGTMVIPVREQMLRVVSRGGQAQISEHGPYRFVRLITGE